jgi:hypothetical protein
VAACRYGALDDLRLPDWVRRKGHAGAVRKWALLVIVRSGRVRVVTLEVSAQRGERLVRLLLKAGFDEYSEHQLPPVGISIDCKVLIVGDNSRDTFLVPTRPVGLHEVNMDRHGASSYLSV